jgi:hypothetical protein
MAHNGGFQGKPPPPNWTAGGHLPGFERAGQVNMQTMLDMPKACSTPGCTKISGHASGHSGTVTKPGPWPDTTQMTDLATGATRSTSGKSFGATTQTGTRGGIFHLGPSGKKVYEHK